MLLAIFVSAKTANNMSKHLGSSDIVAEIEGRIQILTQEIHQAATMTEPPTSAAELEALEQRLQLLTKELSDWLTALQVQKALDSTELRQDSLQLIGRQPRKLRDCGQRSVRVRFAGGTVVPLRAT